MGMSGGGINRNPTEMLNYAHSLEKSVEIIENELINTMHALDTYASELDSKSQEGIERFKENSKKISAQLEEYRNLAKMLKKNANDIQDLIGSVKF
ncbi:MAG: hypothetical protein IKE65_10400 [Clostridia bacterium]|nr:hypothetical protein [Clostridia bacterium]